jgi:hypothetical protein
MGVRSDNLSLGMSWCDFRSGVREMRSALITACVLLGTYAPATRVHTQFQDAPAQAQAAPPERQGQTDRDRQEGTRRPDFRRGDTSVAQESAVARRRANSHRPLGGPATDASPQPGARQLPAAMGLLLALALLNGGGSAPPAVSQPEIKPWVRMTGDVKAPGPDREH